MLDEEGVVGHPSLFVFFETRVQCHIFWLNVKILGVLEAKTFRAVSLSRVSDLIFTKSDMADLFASDGGMVAVGRSEHVLQVDQGAPAGEHLSNDYYSRPTRTLFFLACPEKGGERKAFFFSPRF